MHRYHIKIHLSDHKVIDAKAEAESLEEAVDKIVATEQAKGMMGENEIEAIQMVGSEEIRPVTHDRFLLQESNDPGYWIVTDQQKGIVCKFLERNFGKDHEITGFEGTPVTDATTLVEALREIGGFLYARHPELIC